MERPLLPAFLVTIYSTHLQKTVSAPIIVPNKTLPMDLYNALSNNGVIVEDAKYGWITSRGNYLSGEEAAKIAFENGLIDEKVLYLSVENFSGEWRR